MKRLLAATLLLALLPAASAAADPVQDFGVQLKDLRPDGRYTVVFSSNSFDTSGGPPPALTRSTLRFPKAITIRPEFLRTGRLCDAVRFKRFLILNQSPKLDYEAMISKPAQAERILLKTKLSAADRTLLRTCTRAFLGRGTGVADGRPLFTQATIPGTFAMYLSKPTVKGAFASIGVLARSDTRSAIVRNDFILRQQKPQLNANLFRDPTPDGRYGYRMLLPLPKVGTFTFSITELRAEATGIFSGGSFWAARPRCPADGRLGFRADYAYVTGLKQSKTISIPCPRFR
ncbi:MAG: hypothetical protein MUC84_07790 [Solirubrobacteraceae bacterium]|jgi:hypothetical protein|nr:hypothetical protein [Solirubrobacteraceae bacterium]